MWSVLCHFVDIGLIIEITEIFFASKVFSEFVKYRQNNIGLHCTLLPSLMTSPEALQTTARSTSSELALLLHRLAATYSPLISVLRLGFRLLLIGTRRNFRIIGDIMQDTSNWDFCIMFNV